MEYNVDYFIKKFSDIPEHLWTVYNLGNNGEPRCALGHCYENKEETHALIGIFREDLNRRVIDVNNGNDLGYPQSHPKLRVLAALGDIKKKVVTVPRVMISINQP